MTDRNDLERTLDSFLADGPERVPDRVLDAALVEITHVKQRRVWRAPWRARAMSVPFKLAAAAAIVVAVAIGGMLFLQPGLFVPVAAEPSLAPSVAPPASMPPAGETPSPDTSLPAPDPSLPVVGEVLADLDLPESATAWFAATRSAVWIPVPDAGSVIRIDPLTDRVVARIEVAGKPRSLALNEDSVYVPADGAIARIDAETNAVVETIDTPDFRPLVVFLDGDDLWMTDGGSKVGVLDLQTKQLTIVVETLATGMTGVAVGDGTVWVTQTSRGEVLRIDAATHETLGQTRVGPVPVNIAYAFGSAWVASQEGNAVWRIGPDGSVLAEIAMPRSDRTGFAVRGTYGIAASNEALWVATGPRSCSDDPAASGLVRIDPWSETIVARVVAECAYGVAVADNELWVMGSRLWRMHPDR
jgi:hypothetical protein